MKGGDVKSYIKMSFVELQKMLKANSVTGRFELYFGSEVTNNGG